MNTTSIVTVIFAAILLVGAIETIYQIYKLTVIDATARGLKHPKLLGLSPQTQIIPAVCCST